MTRTLDFSLWKKLFSSTSTVTGYFPPLCSFTVTLESKERFPKLSIFESDAEHLPSRIHAWHHPLVVRKFTLYISSTRTLSRRKGNPKLSNVRLLQLHTGSVEHHWRGVPHVKTRPPSNGITNTTPPPHKRKEKERDTIESFTVKKIKRKKKKKKKMESQREN